jgi:hypothetical protein
LRILENNPTDDFPMSFNASRLMRSFDGISLKRRGPATLFIDFSQDRTPTK